MLGPCEQVVCIGGIMGSESGDQLIIGNGYGYKKVYKQVVWEVYWVILGVYMGIFIGFGTVGIGGKGGNLWEVCQVIMSINTGTGIGIC